MRSKFIFLCTLLSLSVEVAYGQTHVDGSDTTHTATPQSPRSKQTKRTDANGKPITVVDFEDASIEGQAKAPSGFVLQSRESSSFRNLIELRRNFRPQIESSQFAVSAQ